MEKIHFKKCPVCGSNNRDDGQPSCWHCCDCGFTECMNDEKEIKEIIDKSRFLRVDEKEKSG